jgi:hypothetical protein
MHGKKTIKYGVTSHPFFNQDLVIGKNYSMFSLLSTGECWGRSHIHVYVHVSKQMCNYWEINIYLCGYIARKNNDIKFANAKRSDITCKYECKNS